MVYVHILYMSILFCVYTIQLHITKNIIFLYCYRFFIYSLFLSFVNIFFMLRRKISLQLVHGKKTTVQGLVVGSLSEAGQDESYQKRFLANTLCFAQRYMHSYLLQGRYLTQFLSIHYKACLMQNIFVILRSFIIYLLIQPQTII